MSVNVHIHSNLNDISPFKPAPDARSPCGTSPTRTPSQINPGTYSTVQYEYEYSNSGLHEMDDRSKDYCI